MDEDKKKEKKADKNHSDEKGFVTKLKTFFTNLKGEFKKIIWPTREVLTKETITVIVTSCIIGAVIVGMDYAFAFAYDLLIKLAVR